MPNGIQTLGTDIVADLQMEQKTSSHAKNYQLQSLAITGLPPSFPAQLAVTLPGREFPGWEFMLFYLEGLREDPGDLSLI